MRSQTLIVFPHVVHNHIEGLGCVEKLPSPEIGQLNVSVALGLQ